MSRQPNFLFFLPDQHRADFVGWSGVLPFSLPNLDRLAARGVRFNNAYTPSPLCAPARACLASGQNYTRCGVPGNNADYPLAQPTYYQRLRDAGYTVAGVGKFDLHKATSHWNLDGSRLLKEWGFTAGIDNEGKWDAISSGRETPKGPYMQHLKERGLLQIHVDDFSHRGKLDGYANAAPTALPDDAYCDNWVANNGLRLLQEFDARKPWHLVVNFTGPHDPLDITQSMEAGAREFQFAAPHNPDKRLDLPAHNRIRQNYAAMVKNIDRQIGRYLVEVERRGELENTVIIYSSDHGEMLGDHGRWAKAVPHEASVKIPFVMSGPGITGGRQSDALVLLHDLAPTMLEMAGAKALENIEAKSLMPVLEGNSAQHRKTAVSRLQKWRMIRDERFKAVEHQEHKPQLFDLLADPHEDHDLAQTHPGELRRLLAQAD